MPSTPRRLAAVRALPVALALAGLVPGPALAEAGSFELASDAWHLVSVPAGDGVTFAELADAARGLPPDAYADPDDPSGWTAFRWDGAYTDPESGRRGRYVVPSLADPVPVGEGFWMIALDPEGAVIELPADAVEAGGATGNGCAPGLACVAVPIAPGEGRNGWSIAGVASARTARVNEFRFVVDDPGHPCEAGCTLDESAALGLTPAGLWTYAPGGPYYLAAGEDRIEPWRGAWAGAASSLAGLAVRLMVPVAEPARTTVLSGTVFEDGEEADDPIVAWRPAGAAAPGAFVVSDDGVFELDGVPVGVPVDLIVDGEYSSRQVRRTTLPDVGGPIALRLNVPEDGRDRSGAVDRNDVVTVVDGEGAGITVAAGGFVRVDGADFVPSSGGGGGRVVVSVDPLDPRLRAWASQLPGPAGASTGDGPVAFAVLGAAGFSARDDRDDAPFADARLAAEVPGTTARVRVALYTATHPDGSPALEGSTVPLWRLDESVGTWGFAADGVAVADAASPSGLVVEADVDALGWYAAGRALDTGSVTVRVAGPAGLVAAVEAQVDRPGLDWAGRATLGVGAAGAAGAQALPVPAGERVCLLARAQTLDGRVAETPRACADAVSGTEPEVVLRLPALDAPPRLVDPALDVEPEPFPVALRDGTIVPADRVVLRSVPDAPVAPLRLRTDSSPTTGGRTTSRRRGSCCRRRPGRPPPGSGRS